MPKYTKEQLEVQYEKLPDVLKDAIFSVEIAEKMFEIGKKHGLTMEKTGFAAEETGFIILGLLPPREFAGSLARRLDIETDKATALASDINHQVFFPLREALKETHQIDVGEGAIRATDTLPRRVAAMPAPDTMKIPAAPAPSTAMPPPARKPTPITLSPLAPTTSTKNKEPIITERIPAAPIKLEPLTPAPAPSKSKIPSPAGGTPPPPVQKPMDEKITEPKKPAPIILYPKFAADLQKEIAPLIGGMSTPTPPGFLTRKETEKIVTEKLAEQKSLASIKSQEIRMGDGRAPQAPDTEKLPPTQEESKKVAPVPPPAVPSLPQEPKVPPPIKLEPLAAPLAEKSPVAPPLGTAKVPALDLRSTPKPPQSPPKTYDGFDPYKEPVE